MRSLSLFAGTLLAGATLLLAACSEGPRAIQVGAEECAHCRMMVSESRFAAQLVTHRGMSHVFDSIECMAEFLDEEAEVAADQIRSLWVTDFVRPGEWIPAEEAHFLRSETLRSPMGLNLSAYSDAGVAREHRDEHGGEILGWAQVRALAAETDVVNRNSRMHSHGH